VTIYKACLTFVQHITQTAPYARQLLAEGFKGNIAEFILFIHFVFSCLHRRSDVFEQAHELGGESERRFPFAVDRTSRDPHASAQALSRARNLRRLFTMSVLRDMKAKIADLPAYLPISQAELILEMQRLELELFRAKDCLHSQHVELDRVAAELVRVRAEHERLAREYKQAVDEIDRRGWFGSALRAGVARLTTCGAGMLVKLWTAWRAWRGRNAARRGAELSEAGEPRAAIPGERIEGAGRALVEPCTAADQGPLSLPARGQPRR
jgi:hypothetical protein